MNKEEKQLIFEALQIGRDAAYEAACDYHEKMKGYRRKEHELMDDDVEFIDKAIELLLSTPVTDTKPGISYYDDCAKIMG